jgi:hypothetical protein
VLPPAMELRLAAPASTRRAQVLDHPMHVLLRALESSSTTWSASGPP